MKYVDRAKQYGAADGSRLWELGAAIDAYGPQETAVLDRIAELQIELRNIPKLDWQMTPQDVATNKATGEAIRILIAACEREAARISEQRREALGRYSDAVKGLEAATSTAALDVRVSPMSPYNQMIDAAQKRAADARRALLEAH